MPEPQPDRQEPTDLRSLGAGVQDTESDDPGAEADQYLWGV